MFRGRIEGLFLFGAFAYVYFLRSRGLLPGLAAGTNWVFRDESAHMAFAFDVLSTVRLEEPHLFDAEWAAQVTRMIEEAVECESQFADDVLSGGVIGLTRTEMRQYLEYVADQRFAMLGLPLHYQARNPFPFMQMQDVQELPTSSSEGYPHTRSQCRARSASMRPFDRAASGFGGARSVASTHAPSST